MGTGTPVISAQVILKSDTREIVSKLTEFFRDAGFTVGPARAGTFPLSGPVALFQQFFSVTLRTSPQGAVESISQSGIASLELPLQPLPAELSPFVDRILFTPLPSFGPTGSF